MSAHLSKDLREKLGVRTYSHVFASVAAHAKRSSRADSLNARAQG